MGNQGAVWFETLSDKSGTVDKQTWDQMRIGMACGPLDNIKEIKKEIEQACSVTPCNYEKVEKILGKFLANVEAIQ